MASTKKSHQWLLTAVAVAIAVVGWGLVFFKTPEEANLPAAKPIEVTAVIESKALTSSLHGNGSVVQPHGVDITVTAPENMTAVISKLSVEPGTSIEFCTSVIEVSGRPVILLRGEIPSYRTLARGDIGDDVAQLQMALRECGAKTGKDKPGTFGKGTENAITRLYRNIGYLPPSTAKPGLGVGAVAPSTPDPQPAGGIAPASFPAHRPTPVSVLADAIPLAVVPGEPTSDPSDGSSNPTEVPTPVAAQGELFFTSSPARLVASSPRGTIIHDGVVATVAFSELRFTLEVLAADRAGLEEGQEISIDVGGKTLVGVLPSIPLAPVKSAMGGLAYPLSIPLPADIDPTLVNQAGTYTMTVGSEVVEPLVVPISALFSGSDGSTYVKKTTGTTSESVTVIAGTPVGGFVALTPLEEGVLSAGDKVIVGRQ